MIPDLAGAGPAHAGSTLDCYDFLRLQAFRPLFHQECNLGAFIQRPISRLLNRREMYKNVFPILTLNEAEAFGSVEPLHNTHFFHALNPFSLFELERALALRAI
jgi:hypothetical protein